jgi:hypothetical protein
LHKKTTRILQAIKDGKLSSRSLQPANHAFIGRTNNAGVSVMNGTKYSTEEYLSFKKKIEATNQQLSALPDDIARHVKQSKVFLVTVVIPEKMVPFAYSESEVCW